MCVWNVWRGESTATAPCAGFGCFSRPEPLMRGICDVKSHYDMMMNGKVWQLVVFNYKLFLALPVCAM